MAKVEIEDRAFQDPGLKVASRHFRISAAAILGNAAVLWRFSQQAEIEFADRETIIAWLDMDRFSKPKLAIEWLILAGFLERTSDENILKIHGNSFRIQRNKIRVQNAKDAIRSRYKKKVVYDSNTTGIRHRLPDRETDRQRDIKTEVMHTSVSTDSPHLEVFKIWNANRGALPECRKLTDTLKRKLKARWLEEPDPGYWLSCVQKMATSKFCLEGGWASFQWLVKNDDNHAKVKAGNYDNREAGDNASESYWDEVKRLMKESDLKNEA